MPSATMSLNTSSSISPDDLISLTCNEIQHLFLTITVGPLNDLAIDSAGPTGDAATKYDHASAITRDTPQPRHEDHDLQLVYRNRSTAEKGANSMQLLAGTLEHAGSPLHYWIGGRTNGPLVCCSHGASMDHHMFDQQLPALVDAGYRVLVWDLPGHGRSKPIGDSFSIASVAAALKALIHHLDHDRAVLLGQSFGGYVSQELYYSDPDLVTALVIVGATSLTYPMSSWNRLALRLSPAMFTLWPNRSRVRLVGQGTAVTQTVQNYAQGATNQLSKKEFAQVWGALARGLRKEPDFRIHRPVLLTHGSDDQVGVVAASATEWAAREPDCQYVVIPGAGHNANQDNAEYFNQVLLEFLAARLN